MDALRKLRLALALSAVSGMALPAAPALSQAVDSQISGVTIDNAFRSGQKIVVQSGKAQSVAQPGNQVAVWDFEPLGGGRYRIRNRADGTYLHLENAAVPQSTNVPANYATSWWFLESVSGGYYRIKNQYRNTYLNTESGQLGAGPPDKIPPEYATSWWKLSKVDRASQPAIEIVAPGLALSVPTKPISKCGNSIICFIQIVGLVAKQRTEISTDEVYVTTAIGSNQNRFPQLDKKTQKPINTGGLYDLVQKEYDYITYPVMEMDPDKEWARSWNICHIAPLREPMTIRVIESDKFGAKFEDNPSTNKDDLIGEAVFDNNNISVGNYSREMTGDGGKYELVYSVSDRRDALPSCQPSNRRDPDLDQPANTKEASYCEEQASSRLGGQDPSTSEMAIVLLLTIGICEASGGDPNKKS